jgi:hypothetical protein
MGNTLENHAKPQRRKEPESFATLRLCVRQTGMVYFSRVPYGRTGSLFEHPFERIEVTSGSHLFHLVPYIHRNPQTHGLIADFREWPFSSYHVLCSTRPTYLRRDHVLAWCGGPAQLAAAHRCPDDDQRLAALRMEDFD